MKKIHKHIEIVSSTLGGSSPMNARSREAIRAVLADYYTHVAIVLINTEADLEALVQRRPDIVFVGRSFIPISSTSKKDASKGHWLSQYLDAHGIAYTGSRQQAQYLGLQKHLAKQRLLDVGIATSPYAVVPSAESCVANSVEHALSYPLFVKPTDRGGGMGVDSQSLVQTAAELLAKIQSLAQEVGTDVLIEEYLPGREFSVAILRDEKSSELTAMPIELGTMDGPLTSEAKTANLEHIMPVHDPDIRAAVCTLAIDAFQALGARDFGRIDIKLDAAGIPHFLEVNLIPSLIDGYGSFPKACRLNAALSHADIILTIVRLALERADDREETAESKAYLRLSQPEFV